MTISQRVFSLWPTIGEMARDLNESPGVLLDLRKDGLVPDARHDEMIVGRAFYMGKRLTQADLIEARKNKRPDILKADRRDRIDKFFRACGGYMELAKALGCTPNVLVLAKSRAYLPKAWKSKILAHAEKIDHTLEDELFQMLR